MRWYSTPESVESGEVSVLAVVETVLACSFSAYASLRFDTVGHLALGALIAPFLMLRTDRSTELGLACFARYSRPFGDTNRGIVATVAIVGPLAIYARATAVLRSTVEDWRTALAAIPTNWRRYCLATDMASPPEVVAGAEQTDREGLVTFGRLFNGVALAVGHMAWALHLRSRSPSEHAYPRLPVLFAVPGILVVAALIALLGFVPALMYRWSFKSTAIIYLPLVWVTRSTIDAGLKTTALLKRITKADEIEKLRRVWSTFVLGLVGAKGLYVYGWVSLAWLGERLPGGKLTELFVQPDALPVWQIAAALNASLTFLLFWYAARALPYLQDGAEKPRDPTRAKHVVEGIAWTRGVLSWASIGAVAYIFAVESFGLTWPLRGTWLVL